MIPVPHRTGRIRRPWGVRTAMLALAVLALVVLASSAAFAHASLVSSQPAPGSDLAAAPGTVRMRFTEPLIPDLSSVTVTDPLGQTFPGGPSGDTEMQADVDSSAPGIYTVEWKTVSPIDGHTLTGSFQFGVGADVGEQAGPSDAPGTSDLVVAILRAVEYVGLLGALGLLSLSALSDRVGTGWRPAGLGRWVVLAAAGGIGTVSGEVLLAASGDVVAAARGFLATSTGRVRLVRVIIELVAVGVTVIAVRRGATARVEPRRARVATALLVMGALVAVAAAGHAAAVSHGVWVAAGHLWTAGVWAGTILAMAVHRPPGGWRGDLGRGLAREFTPIALSAFAATALLGLVRGVQELAHPSDLWTTAYGQVLWAKTSLVAVMMGLSLLAWRRTRQQAGGEGVVAAVVVLLAAVLVAFPVPPGRAGDDPAAATAADTNGLPQSGDLTLARGADDTVVGLSIRPGEPGINDLYLHLVPPGGDDADQVEVSVTVADDNPVETRPCGEACRVATAPLEAGTTLTIDLTGLAGATGEATFTIPELPAPDATDTVTALREQMDALTSVRYDEVLGPGEPPTRSTWELVLPDRLHGTVRSSASGYRETIRIADRWWNRESPDGTWTEARSSGEGLEVRVDNFIWDDDTSNHHLLGTDTVDGVPTRVVGFFTEVGQLPVWYRLWVDDDHLVRRAVMLTQGHFMEHRYHDHDAPITVDPPT